MHLRVHTPSAEYTVKVLFYTLSGDIAMTAFYFVNKWDEQSAVTLLSTNDNTAGDDSAWLRFVYSVHCERVMPIKLKGSPQ